MNTAEVKKQIVLVDSDSEVHDLITAYFKPKGFRVTCFADPEVAIEDSSKYGEDWSVLLTNYHFSHMSVDDFTLKLKQSAPRLPIVLLNNSSTGESLNGASRQGVFDFILQPIDFVKLHENIEKRILNEGFSKNKNLLVQKVVKQMHVGGNTIIGNSPVFRQALELAKKVAASRANIFISGESGSGKEIFAKYIHAESKSDKGKFVAINCSAIPENLLESELFGHAKGSFTGAYDKKIGLFEEAQDGTLFLDEIGDLTLSLQAKLLRVLQEKSIKRVGENQFREINCRIISATHKDLAFEVRHGGFREDLYFRLNVIPIAIPPLRERREDLLPLAESFLKKFAASNQSVARTFSKEAIEFLYSNPWRGNVRELENTIERAVALCSESEISIDHVTPLISGLGFQDEVTERVYEDNDFHVHCDFKHMPTLDEVIYKYIEYAVKKNNGAREKTAKEIGIDRKTLYKRMKRDGMQVH